MALVSIACVSLACGTSSEPPSTAPPAPLNRTEATPRATTTAVETAPAAATDSAAAVSSEPPPDAFAGKPFPPAAVKPMHGRTAAEGDGTWQLLDDDVAKPAVMARMTLHPDPIKKWVFVTFVAFDRRHVELGLVAGTEEPETDSVPEERRTGLVPEAAQARLLATFNGGFKAKHGNYGMRVGSDQYVPPKDQACTVASMRDGGVVIGAWPALAAEVNDMRFYRQTPPCLLAGGKRSELLKAEARNKWWGSAKGGKLDIRRSAIMLDPSGRSLLYAFGDWISASQLTSTLEAVGIRDAAQLDINWSYTRFFLFEHPAAQAPQIRETIIPELKFTKNRYISKPSYRDFFFVTRR